MLYERGFLRYIGYRESEILRMIYFALRDENWNTCEHVITHEEKDISWETFVIDYQSVHRKDGENIIRWKCKIEGFPDSRVRFTIDGEVLQNFKKNRAGFCILHPLKNVVGQPAEITTPKSEKHEGKFPTSVAPQNPFKQIQRLKWNFENRWYELMFEGDVFETEDQRNWTDASFKTHCTPADLPIPVTLAAGTRIFQRVSFRPLEKLEPITSHDSTVISLEKTNELTTLPLVGICLSSFPMTRQASERVKSLNLDHLSIEVKPSINGWVSKFSEQCEIAHALDLPLHVILTLPQHANDFADQFIALIHQNRINIKNILFLSENAQVTDQQVIRQVSKMKAELPNVKFGAGTTGDFKDLNRNRFEPFDLDFVSYSANPQVHMTDDRTLIENIDGLGETGKSASLIYPHQAVHIAPITLQSRASRHADPRMKTDFAARWIFGALRATAEAKVSSISVFNTAGENGIQSEAGDVYPVYSLLEKILAFRNHEIVVLKNSEPLLIDAMLFSNESSTTLMIVNYTDDLQTVKFGKNEFQVPPMQTYEINLSST